MRHPLPDDPWPTAEQAAAGRWFQPVQLGPLTARHRTWVPAMVPWRAGDDGSMTQAVLDWYGRFARGRPGVLVVEATGIRDIPSGPLLRIGHDRFVDGLRALVEVVRRESEGQTRLLIQLIDFLAIRRRPEKGKFLGRFLAVTDAHRRWLAERGLAPEGADDDAVRNALAARSTDELREVLTEREYRDLAYGYRETVNDEHLPHVAELPRVLPGLFADAADRARLAGFDGVELHYAHAYTMASFLSRTNARTDGFGGSREGRVRLPVEVLRAVQQRVGEDYCVGLRMLGDEVIEGGSRIDDAVFYARALGAAGAHFVSVSKGGRFEDARQPNVGEAAYPYTGPSGKECMPPVFSDERGPFGRNVPLAAAIRRGLRDDGIEAPVVAAGGICTFPQAEGVLERGEADIVAAARQTLADPDWFEKVRTGRGAEVRRCLFTNYCEGLDQKHKEVTCQLWDREFEPGEPIPLSRDGKRRLLAP